VYNDGFLVQKVKPIPHQDAIVVMLREQNRLPSTQILVSDIILQYLLEKEYIVQGEEDK
jgi:hypothetical protein